MTKRGGPCDEPSLLARMQSQWKLARALGICNIMIIHALSDLDAVGEANSQSRNLALGLLRDCGTKIVYAQEADQIERTCSGLGLSSAEASELLKLDQGEALWRVGTGPVLRGTASHHRWPRLGKGAVRHEQSDARRR